MEVVEKKQTTVTQSRDWRQVLLYICCPKITQCTVNGFGDLSRLKWLEFLHTDPFMGHHAI